MPSKRVTAVETVFMRSARPSFVALSLSFAACTGSQLGSESGGRGCNAGGANDQVKAPGNAPGGVDLAYGDIAVSPDGSYVVYDHAATLAVAWTKTSLVEALPLEEPSRLGFAKDRHVVYVSSTKDGAVHAIDVDSATQLWSSPLGEYTDGFLAVAESDTRLVFAASKRLWVLDAKDGHVLHDLALSSPPVDLKILPDDERVLVVEQHTFPPAVVPGPDAPTANTIVHVLDMATGQDRAISVPNCSDDIVVTGDGKMAFLAPTSCSKDPISVIDLVPGKEAFRKNLPGFGPVVLAPDGVTAVGFLDRAQADASLFDDPKLLPAKGAYHLMVIDTPTLQYAFYEYGDICPRYALSPNGKALLVDESNGLSGISRARLFDMETRAFETIEGPAIQFEQVALSSDSVHAYVLSNAQLTSRTRGRGRRGAANGTDYGLYDLELDAAKVAEVPLDFRPVNVNIAPDDGSLFLRRNPREICLFSLTSKSCERELKLDVTAGN